MSKLQLLIHICLQEEYKRKNEKLLKLQAKKKAEVLAITRGDDSDVEEISSSPSAASGAATSEKTKVEKIVESAQEVCVEGMFMNIPQCMISEFPDTFSQLYHVEFDCVFLEIPVIKNIGGMLLTCPVSLRSSFKFSGSKSMRLGVALVSTIN